MYTKFPYGKKSVRQKFFTAKLSDDKIFIRQNNRTVKFPTVSFPYSKISVRWKFLLRNFSQRNLLRRNFQAPETEATKVCQRCEQRLQMFFNCVNRGYKICLGCPLPSFFKEICNPSFLFNFELSSWNRGAQSFFTSSFSLSVF